MSLIAKNKITEYIAKHPQARIPLLTWMKEYPYREGKNFFTYWEGNIAGTYSAGQSQPGIGDYIIKYKINYPAKAVLITWVGSKEELAVEMDREFKEM
ncbi:MAG: hypothetical protein EOP45_00770 [Sphingobacteriaceae bacterium]|nr:MAG: hypothetical protein EOP45_00770 [Sphingobacteriaceae bacterium]